MKGYGALVNKAMPVITEYKYAETHQTQEVRPTKPSKTDLLSKSEDNIAVLELKGFVPA